MKFESQLNEIKNKPTNKYKNITSIGPSYFRFHKIMPYFIQSSVQINVIITVFPALTMRPQPPTLLTTH